MIDAHAIYLFPGDHLLDARMRGGGNIRQFGADADECVDVEEAAVVGEFTGELPVVKHIELLTQDGVEECVIVQHPIDCRLQCSGLKCASQNLLCPRHVAPIGDHIVRDGWVLPTDESAVVLVRQSSAHLPPAAGVPRMRVPEARYSHSA